MRASSFSLLVLVFLESRFCLIMACIMVEGVSRENGYINRELVEMGRSIRLLLLRIVLF